jgi:hypothetical protein
VKIILLLLRFLLLVVSPATKIMFGNVAATAFLKVLNFFLLKLNMVCMFWIVLMC